MRIRFLSASLFGTLALSLIVAGCGPLETGNQPQTATQTGAPASTQPAATAAPATAEPTAPHTAPTDAPTAPPPATAEQPAATAQPDPTEQPAPEPKALLPAGQSWIQTGNTIIALGDQQRQIHLQAPDFPAYRSNAVVAPDASHIAYINQNDQLTVVDASGNVLALPQSAGQIPMGYQFSPDSRALAVALNDGQHWLLQVVDLQSGTTRTLQEGALFSQAAESPPLALMPIAWTPAGILTQRILWASDAPPQGLVLVHPADGSARPLRQGSHIQAASAPDGQRIAIVTGETPIGPEAQPSMAIRVLDTSSGNEQVIVAEKPGFVRELLWSPDSALLLYSASEQYDSKLASVVLASADGTNERRVDFSLDGLNQMSLHDLAWADSQTALVLLANTAARIDVNALPTSSFEASSMQPLGTLNGQLDAGHQIIYVPRGV